MDVNQIKLKDGLPSEVTVTMPLAEVVAIAAVFGAMNGYAFDRLGAPPDSGPYDVLVGDVLNRYWENGLREFMEPISLKELNDRP